MLTKKGSRFSDSFSPVQSAPHSSDWLAGWLARVSLSIYLDGSVENTGALVWSSRRDDDDGDNDRVSDRE